MNIRSVDYLFLFATCSICCGQRPATAQDGPFVTPEKLSYRIEWRMVTAGQAKLQFTRSQPNWLIDLKLESAGLVSRLFRVEDLYKVTSNERFCAISTSFEAQEGKRHVISSQQFDNARHKLTFEDRDLEKKTTDRQELDIPPCTYEIVGALAALREVHVEAGKSIMMPIANGRKLANARIEAQAKETLTVDSKSYSTMRYEAFIFDGILFRKKGRAFVWISDDAERMPVQMRFQMAFPIGNITLELEKPEAPRRP